MMSSFEADIRPLFRESDRVEMDFMFDLWSYDDVRADAANILSRVVDGTMPCDITWSSRQVALLRAWMEEGYPP
jgi:hypothetical protein